MTIAGRIRKLMAAGAMLVAGTAPALAQQAPLSVMSFNIRYANPGDGANAWDKRRDVTAAMLERTAPDIIGTQELLKEQGDFLAERLKNYAWFGTDRRGGHADEHMGIFYRRDRLRLIESGQFWLSDTPETPGTSAWGADLPRMANWGLFETIDGKRRFYLLDTHLPHRAEDEPAREKGVALILRRLEAMTDSLPLIVTGDFNTTPDSAAHALLAASLTDAREVAAEKAGPEGTFHGFTGTPGKRIDFIFTRGFAVHRVETVTDHRGAVQTSDHFPVLALLGWPGK